MEAMNVLMGLRNAQCLRFLSKQTKLFFRHAANVSFSPWSHFKFQSNLLRKSQTFREVGHSCIHTQHGFPFFNFTVVQHSVPLHWQGWDVFGKSFEPEADLSHTMCSYNKTVRKLTKVIRAPKKMIKDQFRIQTLLRSRRTCEANFQQKTFFHGFWVLPGPSRWDRRKKVAAMYQKKGTCENSTEPFPGMRATCRKKPALWEAIRITGKWWLKFHDQVQTWVSMSLHKVTISSMKVGLWIHIHWSGSRWMCLWLMTYHDLSDQISCLAHLLRLRHGLWGRFMSPSRGSPKKAPFIVIGSAGVRGRCWMPKRFINLV